MVGLGRKGSQEEQAADQIREPAVVWAGGQGACLGREGVGEGGAARQCEHGVRALGPCLLRNLISCSSAAHPPPPTPFPGCTPHVLATSPLS